MVTRRPIFFVPGSGHRHGKLRATCGSLSVNRHERAMGHANGQSTIRSENGRKGLW
jgi:hypothetical protein